FEGIKNSIGIGNLVKGRRTFGAIAPAAARILRIAFELLNLICFFVDIGEEPARRLAIETSRRHELVMPLLALRPRLRIQLSPIVPALFWWEGGEMDAGRTGIGVTLVLIAVIWHEPLAAICHVLLRFRQ